MISAFLPIKSQRAILLDVHNMKLIIALSFWVRLRMVGLAGSAIAQKITFEKISISNHEVRWLLLSGATDPPSDISISNRRNRYFI